MCQTHSRCFIYSLNGDGNTHSSPLSSVLFLYLFYRFKKWKLREGRYLTKVTQLMTEIQDLNSWLLGSNGKFAPQRRCFQGLGAFAVCLSQGGRCSFCLQTAFGWWEPVFILQRVLWKATLRREGNRQKCDTCVSGTIPSFWEASQCVIESQACSTQTADVAMKVWGGVEKEGTRVVSPRYLDLILSTLHVLLWKCAVSHIVVGRWGCQDSWGEAAENWWSCLLVWACRKPVKPPYSQAGGVMSSCPVLC